MFGILAPAAAEVKPADVATVPVVALVVASDDDWIMDDATLEAMAEESAAYEQMMTGAYAY